MPRRPDADDSAGAIRIFTFHGVELTEPRSGDQAKGVCPWCDSEKFYVNINSSLWDCKSCSASGNDRKFLSTLWELSLQATKENEYESLAEDRGLIDPETLVKWGAAKSTLTGEWLLPSFNPDGVMNNLYRYALTGGKRRLLSTPTLSHGLFGVPLCRKKSKSLIVTEGPWDGMAAWEAKPAGFNVVSIPGVNVFPDSWGKGEVFVGREVIFMFDNDHPKRGDDGAAIEPGTVIGIRKACSVLSTDKLVDSVRWLAWGPYGWDTEVPHGYDVRDHLGTSDNKKVRKRLLIELLDRCDDPPEDWLEGKKGKQKTDLLPIPCSSWGEVKEAWEEAYSWSVGLNRALVVMLASASSTVTPEDQLWVKIIGPPSCGKSTLCEALSVSKSFTRALSSLRGFHSGYQQDRDGTEDSSLLSKLDGMTLILKDGDTLLSSPNLGQILAEARDIYDRVSRTSYRNKQSRDYEGINLTWLLCGTSSLRKLDSSELGQRFLDCVIMEGIDPELETLVNQKKGAQVFESLTGKGHESGRDGESESLMRAKQLTGGYLEYLRLNHRGLAQKVRPTPRVLTDIDYLAKMVAYLRTRPSKIQDEEIHRELSTRLVSQLSKLTVYCCVVLGKSEIDLEVMDIIKHVAFATGRGITMDLVRILYDCGREGMLVKVIIAKTGREEEKEKSWLRFLKNLGVAESVSSKYQGKTRWRLSESMRDLWRRCNSISDFDTPF